MSTNLRESAPQQPCHDREYYQHAVTPKAQISLLLDMCRRFDWDEREVGFLTTEQTRFVVDQIVEAYCARLGVTDRDHEMIQIRRQHLGMLLGLFSMQVDANSTRARAYDYSLGDQLLTEVVESIDEQQLEQFFDAAQDETAELSAPAVVAERVPQLGRAAHAMVDHTGDYVVDPAEMAVVSSAEDMAAAPLYFQLAPDVEIDDVLPADLSEQVELLWRLADAADRQIDYIAREHVYQETRQIYLVNNAVVLIAQMADRWRGVDELELARERLLCTAGHYIQQIWSPYIRAVTNRSYNSRTASPILDIDDMMSESQAVAWRQLLKCDLSRDPKSITGYMSDRIKGAQVDMYRSASPVGRGGIEMVKLHSQLSAAGDVDIDAELKRAGYDPDRLGEVLGAMRGALSLDADTVPVLTSELPAPDAIADTETVSIDRLLEQYIAGATTDRAVGVRQRNADIVRGYFGVCGYSQKTMAEMAVQYGLTESRISQICSETAERLRRLLPPHMRELNGLSTVDSPIRLV